MRTLMIVMIGLGLLASFGVGQAAVPVGSLESLMRSAGPVRGSGALDEQCTANFLGFTYGSYLGSEMWPGGSGTFYMTGYMVSTTCEPGDTAYCYCMDLDHSLRPGPYCANMDPIAVRAAYPEQYPAMAYLMAWFPVMNESDDRVMQLALWKMTNDNRIASPTYGAPWYTINGGRGAPNPNDVPSYPYVNTVYNTEPTVNIAANERLHYLLGFTDGIAKNVAMCDDQFTTTTATRIDIGEDSARVPVTVQLNRGAGAAEIGNTSVGGVRVLLAVSAGSLSLSEGFTDAAGQIHLTITQSRHTPVDVDLQICTNAGWVKSIIPCEGYFNQQLITSENCNLCVTRVIPGDFWLPVELTSFTAMARENDIQLSWRTASEANTSLWEIERAESGSGIYARIASLPAANMATGQDYRYEDAAAVRGTEYDYRLVDVDMNGQRTEHSDMIRTAGLSAAAVGLGYELGTNYPNPFNPETNIRFVLAETGLATLKVYDVTGHEVATLMNDKLSAGEHTVSFRAANLPSGIYFYKLTAGSFTQTRKMVLAK